MTTQRLVLGTAQLGMQYGIANTSGKPDAASALELVRRAWEGGVREFDTAHGYGESESVLGHVLSELGIAYTARVISKPDIAIDFASAAQVRDAVSASLERLKIPRLAGLLLHREAVLDSWEQGPKHALEQLRSQGLVERIGISVYSPAAALRALQLADIDAVQIPANIWDRRFERAGVFALADRLGKTLYLRSVFLQGLLLLPEDSCPHGLAAARPLMRALRELATAHGLDNAALALGFVRHAYPNAQILFGAETPQQVSRNLDSWNAPFPAALLESARAHFTDAPEEILNPSLWK